MVAKRRWSQGVTQVVEYVQEARASAPPPNSKRATRNRRRIGRLLLFGLAGVGAAILLFIGSFSDPITAMGNLYSAFANPEAPVLQAAVKPVEIQLAEVKPTDQNGEEAATPDLPRQADVTTPQNPPARTLTAMSADTPPAYPNDYASAAGSGRGGPLNAYVVQSRRGTWLFPPNPNQ